MFWHYTIGAKFRLLVESGEIRPATAGVPKGEQPIVWFSRRHDWEATANKALFNDDGAVVFLTKEQTAERGGGLVQIGSMPKQCRTIGAH